MDNASRVINGTFLTVWFEDKIVGEAKSLQAKIAFNKTEVNMCGKMAVDTKITSWKGTGSLGMFKTNSRMAIALEEGIINGKDLRFNIVAKLDDPDAYGYERIAVNNISFDDLTLIDAAANTNGEITAPFTFTDYKFLDKIVV